MQRKKKPYPNLNSYDYSWFAREMTEEELYKVNGGSTVEDNHTVQSGDTLGTLVYNYNQEHGTNLTVNEVAANNGIDNPNLIYVGQQINFGKSDENQENPQSGNTNHTDNISTSETNTNINTQTQNVSYNMTTNTTSQTNKEQNAVNNTSNNSELNEQCYIDSKNSNRVFANLDNPKSLKQAQELLSDPNLGIYVVAYGEESGMTRVFNNYAELNQYLYDKLEDGNDKNLVSKEKDVIKFLKTIEQNPADYSIEVYDRKALLPYLGKKNKVFTHSLFVITQKSTNQVYTLSFNGTNISLNSEGEWIINSKTDVSGYNWYMKGFNIYDMNIVYRNDKIDIEKTAENIIGSITTCTTYYALDHMNDKMYKENCVTALYNTIAFQPSGRYLKNTTGE